MESTEAELWQLVPILERDDRDRRDEEDRDDGSDDDKEAERHEYELERELAAFRDEPRVTHNVLPESDVDESGDSEDEDKGYKQRNREYTPLAEGMLVEDMVFFNRVAFKDAIVKYVCRTGRNLKQYRYDKTKIAYKCVGSSACTWRIYCSRVVRSDEWSARIYNKVHSCSVNGRCEMMNVPVIARLFLDKIRDEPNYFLPMKMEAFMLEKWKVKASRHQCQAVRKMALRWNEKEYEAQFARFRDYAAEIMDSNPNSTVHIETVKNGEGQDEFGNSMYASIKLRGLGRRHVYHYLD